MSDIQAPEPTEAGACKEPELTTPVRLCGDDGSLNPEAVGWSREPVHDCALPGSWGRRKRWDYWCITSPECVFVITYANVDYVGLADVWFLDRKSQKAVNRSAISPLAIGFGQPDSVAGGPMRHSKKGFEIAIVEEDGGTRLSANVTSSGSKLSADIFVKRPEGHETLSVVIPWGERQFQCTTKENTRPAVGTVTLDNTTYDLEEGTAWGCLDFGRGKWPYSTIWNWGSASGEMAGRIVGLQLGGKWTDGTGMTENALCIDGRLSKISEELTWEYDTDNWLAPWKMRTPDSDRVDLTFKPTYDKESRLEALVASSTVHQCFGNYSGSVIDDAEDLIEIDDLFGWAEEARWRW